MNSFNFYNPTEIIYGKGRINEVGKIIKEKIINSNKILIVTSNSSKKNGSLDNVKNALIKNDLEYFIFDKIVSNPNLDYIDEAIKIIKSNNINFILALGGASVIDTAKTISVAAFNNKDIWELICNPTEIKGAIPFGAIISLYGSGTEMTNGAVITNSLIPKKRGFDSNYMYPKFSIMDPELLKSVPNDYLKIGATDMFIHVLEQYFEITSNENLSDEYLELLSRQIINEINKFKDEKQNNENLFWLSTLAQNKFLTFGKEYNGEWVAHIISHEFCLKYNLPHGRVVSILFLSWLDYIKNINGKRIIRFGEEVYRLSNPTEDEVINCIRKTLLSLDNKTNLRDLGVKREELDYLIEQSTKGKTLGKKINITITDVKKIVEKAFYGI